MKKTPFMEGWTCNGQSVILPHDAMLHTQRSADAPSGGAGAYFAGGSYVYEKTWILEEASEHILFVFEGVYKNAQVYINGQLAGGAAYGYIPFTVCADAYVKPGENLIRVTCENAEQPDSRWYSGAGIYRPVWMWTGPADGIEPDSVRIRTLSISPAVIHIGSEKPVVCTVDGVTGEGTDFTLTIPEARLWSADTPYLYTAHLQRGDDTLDIRFGIRQIRYSPQGLYINGRETLLRGGCLHHDNGILGAATFPESEYRRVQTLKAAGFNAIRSAHNPASRALLEACDALGMYVMDEAWDMWFWHKTPHDYAGVWREHYTDDLRALVRRDYNHPSVLFYSIGNEVSEPCKPEGVTLAREMVDLLHELDPDRPVTGGYNLMIISAAAKGRGIYKEDGSGRDESLEKKSQGMNSTVFNLIASVVGTGMNHTADSKKADAITSPVLDLMDIAGYNYASGRYPLEGKNHPERVIVGSETFPQDIYKNWALVKKYPYLIGDFMWTAIDYLGEVGIGAWAYTPDGRGFSKPYPWLLADVGAFDILCNPTGEAFLAAAVWGKLDRPRICVQPIHPGVKPAKAVWRGTNAIASWSWRGCDGERAVVEVYTDAHIVELMLNGQSVGRKAAKGCRAIFHVRYTPGTLTAVAYDAAGREVGRDSLHSATGKLHIACTPESLHPQAGELVYIPVRIVDRDGVVESNADQTLRVEVTGGTLLGFGSARPRGFERFDSGIYTTYYGHALAVVRADGSGPLRVRAKRIQT